MKNIQRTYSAIFILLSITQSIPMNGAEQPTRFANRAQRFATHAATFVLGGCVGALGILGMQQKRSANMPSAPGNPATMPPATVPAPQSVISIQQPQGGVHHVIIASIAGLTALFGGVSFGFYQYLRNSALSSDLQKASDANVCAQQSLAEAHQTLAIIIQNTESHQQRHGNELQALRDKFETDRNDSIENMTVSRDTLGRHKETLLRLENREEGIEKNQITSFTNLGCANDKKPAQSDFATLRQEADTLLRSHQPQKGSSAATASGSSDRPPTTDVWKPVVRDPSKK